MAQTITSGFINELQALCAKHGVTVSFSTRTSLPQEDIDISGPLVLERRWRVDLISELRRVHNNEGVSNED